MTEKTVRLDMVAHICKFSTQEFEGCGLRVKRAVWPTWWDPDLPEGRE